jgi:S-layer homology domain
LRKLLTPLLGLAMLLATIWAVSIVAAASEQIRAAQGESQFAPTNPIVGFDFEDGTVQGWEVNTNTLTTTTGVQNTTSQHYSGTRSLVANIHDSTNSTITLSAVDVRNVSTGNIITAHIQLRATFAITAEAALAAVDADGNYHFGTPVGVPTNQWVTLTLLFTDTVPMPLQELGAGIGIAHIPITFDANYYIDDVEWDTVALPTATPTVPPSATSPPSPTASPPAATNTPAPSTATPAPATSTPILPTGTPILPTGTPILPTGTPILPTGTPILPTGTPILPTGTPILPTGTPGLTTATPAPPTGTPQPSVTPTDCPNPFVDINGNVFYGAIHYLNCRGVVNGTDPTHYSPAGTSTRGQFAKVVVLGFGTPFYTPSSGQDFTDVPPSYFAYLYIETGFHYGILSGFDRAGCTAHNAQYPCYLPNIPITRGQLTKLVVNAGGYQLYTPTSGPDFIDVPPSNVFYPFIETAYHYGIINGYPDHTFRPNNNIRRDEMAQIVYEGVIHRP